jgi:hypothetical protein
MHNRRSRIEPAGYKFVTTAIAQRSHTCQMARHARVEAFEMSEDKVAFAPATVTVSSFAGLSPSEPFRLTA